MATINNKRITQRPVKKLYAKNDDSSNYYNTMAWHRLRDLYVSLHPMCECCLEHHHIEQATEVHHKKPFINLPTIEDRWSAFLDYDNLLSVCKYCHIALHTKIKRYKLNRCDDLTDKEWKEAHNVE